CRWTRSGRTPWTISSASTAGSRAGTLSRTAGGTSPTTAVGGLEPAVLLAAAALLDEVKDLDHPAAAVPDPARAQLWQGGRGHRAEQDPFQRLLDPGRRPRLPDADYPGREQGLARGPACPGPGAPAAAGTPGPAPGAAAAPRPGCCAAGSLCR